MLLFQEGQWRMWTNVHPVDLLCEMEMDGLTCTHSYHLANKQEIFGFNDFNSANVKLHGLTGMNVASILGI